MATTPVGNEQPLHDRRIEATVALTTPAQILTEHPLDVELAGRVIESRRVVTAILDRVDPRLLVVVGPCSVHDPAAALDYAKRLAALAPELPDLLLVMRVYFEKPRTTTGWKGLINDPHLDDSGDVNAGLRIARDLLLQVVEVGLPIGCEFLDPITPQYIADTVAWGAIGARTTESQTHRQLASGLSMPVGFKNRTDGNVGVAVDAVRAAGSRHSFAGVELGGGSAILRTAGNADCHIILRGGRGTTNYDADSIADTIERLRAVGLPERVIIDASHDNSAKDHERQPAVAAAIAEQVAGGNEAIVGVMLESFLESGRQDLGGTLAYGRSVTDACMDWGSTETVLRGLDEAARARREPAG
ncbi:MAG TPA: 3-deoxy-7-phosphoheptulonate synthase [Solirubrobacterales bacterium]|nr:3-deoxy-7-phosphoheptulonate synthase [Solirubrobacterales bacterium]